MAEETPTLATLTNLIAAARWRQRRLFWQSQINAAPARDVAKQQALVCSYITSAEYHLRFGPNAPRTNSECPQ